MTDDGPNTVSMEDAMQAIREALGYRPEASSYQVHREPIFNLPKDNDFFAKQMAAIEEKAHDADAERLCQTIPLIADCIKKMWLAGLTAGEISLVLRQAADELEAATGGSQM